MNLAPTVKVWMGEENHKISRMECIQKNWNFAGLVCACLVKNSRGIFLWKGARQTFTNPLVGAVITQKDQVIAKGAHLQYGEAHAERNAIANCSSSEELIHSTVLLQSLKIKYKVYNPSCS